jgi:aldehyde dehydrogenase (NAD+)
MAAAYARLTTGPALDDHRVGPLISARQKSVVEGFLATAAHIARGRIVDGAPGAGHYVAPALIGGVAPRSPAGAGRDLRPRAGHPALRR